VGEPVPLHVAAEPHVAPPDAQVRAPEQVGVVPLHVLLLLLHVLPPEQVTPPVQVSVPAHVSYASTWVISAG